MNRRESGFTIIETSLVLAVTGLVIAVVLAGIGNALSHQRYLDAVNQTVDFFRGQYTHTTNTLNNRADDERCDSSGVSTAGVPMSVGASDCLLLGNVIRSSNGVDMQVYKVLALHDPSDDAGIDVLNDIDILNASQLSQGDQTDSFKIDWGARLITPSTGDSAKFTVMVVRTPVSGTIRTYTAGSDTVSVTDLLSSSLSPQIDRTLCIDQAGFFSGIGIDPMGIRITKGAANTTGVQVLASGDCV